ncbi:insulinase family protein [bacterium]|nr:insulinase family protein [bacterium]
MINHRASTVEHENEHENENEDEEHQGRLASYMAEHTKYLFFITTLPCGLRVITAPMPYMESVAIGVWAAVGGRYEAPAQSGISHFLEHLTFKGTRRRTARQISLAIEGVGGTLNGFTGEEVTCYYAKVRYTRFTYALDVLLDMYRGSTFPLDEVERERRVIKEEIKMYLDVPQQVVYDDLNTTMWPGQPLGRALLGTFETVDAMRRSDIVAFHDAYYAPGTTVISVAGNVSHDAAVTAVARALRREWKRQAAPAYAPCTERQRRPRIHLRQRQTEQAHLLIGLRSFGKLDPQRYALRLLSTVLGENMSSRLNHEIREKRGLAYDVDSSITYFYDTGAMRISAGTDVAAMPKTLKLTMGICRDVLRNGVSSRELKHAKDYIRGHIALTLERTAEYMLWLGESLLTTNSVMSVEDILAAYDAVTPDDIQRVAARVFNNRNLSVAVVAPATDERAVRDLATFE